MKPLIEIKKRTSAWLSYHGIIAAALLACPLYAQDSPASAAPTQGSGANKIKGGDAVSFIKEAGQGNAAEAALAEMAERKSQNADVKQFARLLRKDHQQANEQLRPVAQAHGVAIDPAPDSKQQKKLERFRQMSSVEFDREYVKDMLLDHQKDISKYEKASQEIQDPDVKQYAQSTLPTLREHLQHAKHAAEAVGIDPATVSSILKESGSMGGTGDDTEKGSGSGVKGSDQMP